MTFYDGHIFIRCLLAGGLGYFHFQHIFVMATNIQSYFSFTKRIFGIFELTPDNHRKKVATCVNQASKNSVFQLPPPLSSSFLSLLKSL